MVGDRGMRGQKVAEICQDFGLQIDSGGGRVG